MKAKPPSSPLLAHFARVESALLAQSELAAASGHSVNQGTVREAFIRDFLASHVAERLGIGTGEVISATSKDGESRNQLDVIVYNRAYPKLHLGAAVDLYLVESVIAILEIKTTLNKKELKTSVNTARRLKRLSRALRPIKKAMAPWPPRLLYYVVGYGGYETLDGVHKAVADIHSKERISMPDPINWKGDGKQEIHDYHRERVQRESPSIDGAILLGKGYVQFDNAHTWFLPDEMRKQFPSTNWEIVEAGGIGLHHLYMNIVHVADTAAFWVLDPKAYERGVGVGAGTKVGAFSDKPVRSGKA